MSDRIDKLLAFLKDTPNDCFLNHALALEYIKLERYEDAETLFVKNLANEPAYVATYYHYAKLLEGMKKPEKAIEVYEKGMAITKEVKDMHAYSELQSAYEDLVY